MVEHFAKPNSQGIVLHPKSSYSHISSRVKKKSKLMCFWLYSPKVPSSNPEIIISPTIIVSPIQRTSIDEIAKQCQPLSNPP